MSKSSELQAKANELFGTEFTWYVSQDPRGGQLAVGIDWDSNQTVFVDLDHPNGNVIQDAGSFDVKTVYEEAN
jgi:hypothetical protein